MAKEILFIVISFGLILTGGLGVVLPFLPGIPIAWLGMLLFAYATGFSVMTWKMLLVFLGLTVISMIIDALGPLLGAKKYNASRWGVIGGIIGIILGIIFLGPIGLILGPFLGTFLGEIWSGKMEMEAFHSAKGALIGFLIGNAIKLAIIMVMFGYLVHGLISFY